MQSLNIDAILYSPYAMFIRKSLLMPHFFVKDISKFNPEKLWEHSFRGLVFDKDNTLTAPYENTIYPTIQESFEKYQSVFGNRIVIMSNSAGTKDDKNNNEAQRIESELGIHVVQHGRKKPGGIDSVMKYFREKVDTNIESYQLVMFGDRILTDIVFGNRYGMMSVHCAYLTDIGDNLAASMIRKREMKRLEKWTKSGRNAPFHRLYHPDLCLETILEK